MNAEEIRELYAETLARAEYEFERALRFTALTHPMPRWEEAAEHERAEYRGFVPHLIDALGEAKLLPTHAEKWYDADDQYIRLVTDSRVDES